MSVEYWEGHIVGLQIKDVLRVDTHIGRVLLHFGTLFLFELFEELSILRLNFLLLLGAQLLLFLLDLDSDGTILVELFIYLLDGNIALGHLHHWFLLHFDKFIFDFVDVVIVCVLTVEFSLFEHIPKGFDTHSPTEDIPECKDSEQHPESDYPDVAVIYFTSDAQLWIEVPICHEPLDEQ